MKAIAVTTFGLALLCASASAQDRTAEFAPEQLRKGAALFARHCATCHGTRMRNPQWAFDLRTFRATAMIGSSIQ